ncbi:MAG TPA: methyl-accepting chemotaxis protein [Methanoregulaceae archaeon]|nr:methyl-accepting chemotaxis protein [Methanoregulaceae archaeon]
MKTKDLEHLINKAFDGDTESQDQLRNVVIGMNDFLIELVPVLKKMAVNDHTGTLGGEYRDLSKEAAVAVNSLRERLLHITGSIEKISVGDVSEYEDYRKIGRRSDQDRIVPAFIKCLGSLNALANDANILAKAAVEGKLATRADASKHEGEYRKIIEGVNATLDSLIGPLKTAADYVDKIGSGMIPSKITAVYYGDFDILKSNLNRCIDGLQGLVEANAVLARMAVNDHTVGIEGTYLGIFNEVKTNVNLVRTRVNHVAESLERIGNGDVSEYEDYKKIGRRSEHDKLVPGFIKTLGSLNALVNDANMLAKAAVEGRLETRADATKHLGEYRKVVEGVNATLDAVIQPVNEAIRIAEAYARCDFSVRVDEKLNVAGDFIKFKEALNQVGIEVSKAIMLINNQVGELMASAEEAQASLEEISSGSEQIARNAQMVNDNAVKGSEGIEQISKVMGDLSAAVEEVASSMESVANLAKETNKLSSEGANLANKADQSMNHIGDSAKIVDINITEINSKMNEIGKIVGLIRDLANQTNLLALNAAIEAARAGEAGRGFAVVAAEVKSLAQESRGSAESIASMIGDLQDKSKKATEAVVVASTQVEQGGKDVAEALKSFNQIVQSIGKISSSTDEVSKAAEQQAASVEEISASVIEVAGLVEGAAKEASNAAAITEEASASIMEINKVVENVNAIASRVSQEMEKFKV